MDILVTTDPPNIHHIMSSNFTNFPKGPEFNQIFDVLGDAISNSDFDSWKNQRKSALALINNQSFHHFLLKTSRDKVENGMIPILEHTMIQVVCLLDSHMFCSPGLWKLQHWLGIGEEKKMKRAKKILDQTIFFWLVSKNPKLETRIREELESIIPEGKSRKWWEFDIQKQHKLAYLHGAICEALRLYPPVSFQHKAPVKPDIIPSGHRVVPSTKILFSLYALEKEERRGERKKREKGKKKKKKKKKRKKKREGEEEGKEEKGIVQVTEVPREIKTKKSRDYRTRVRNHIFPAYILVVLLGCYSLVARPPHPIWPNRPYFAGEQRIRQRSTWSGRGRRSGDRSGCLSRRRIHQQREWCGQRTAEDNVGGDGVVEGGGGGTGTADENVVVEGGRMKSVWGEDCLEFKPERWILKKGGIKRNSSYKFLSFNAGPRTCLRKEVAFTQIKIVAATILHNYNVVQVVEDDTTNGPNVSVILQMKHASFDG
ncbi:hypothetical protein JRO89_XS08G0038000 [Xanthoceras sorbifolium]|uniref:Cytochrome P450 n=1 Tax=Xanthoceras sorbifolium TaxID=99658 RepID=A0ABQ8HNI6_9ROSI|nr:hypothetical protein JRO89_XS08G0038000 [Xanthoceras sorbifolium]